MTVRLRRRTLLTGGITALAVAAGGVVARTLMANARSPESEVADYAKLLADVHDDYVNGRVVEHQGWVLSQHEFDSIDARRSGQAPKAAVSRS